MFNSWATTAAGYTFDAVGDLEKGGREGTKNVFKGWPNFDGLATHKSEDHLMTDMVAPFPNHPDDEAASTSGSSSSSGSASTSGSGSSYSSAEKACDKACTNGFLCCANLPVGAPTWHEMGYLGRCISKGSFSTAQCKDVGGKIPAGQEEYKFVANGATCTGAAEGQDCSSKKPCCGATAWPRTAEAAAQGKTANNKYGYSDGIHYNDHFLECKRGTEEGAVSVCSTTKRCKPVNAACKRQLIGSKCCSGKCDKGHCTDE